MNDRRPSPTGLGKNQVLPVRVYRLGAEPRDDLSELTTPEERIAMVWDLTARAWALTGRPFPDYERHRMPGVIRRPG